MIQCQNCGQLNSPESNFCRSCGIRFVMPPPQTQQQPNTGYQSAAPRAYSWKTDEYQTQTEARKTDQINYNQPFNKNLNAANQYQSPQSLMNRNPQQLAHTYHCPNCGTNVLPLVEKKISTAGWIIFALLLVFTWIFFWIGLLIKEEVRVCPVCRAKFS